MTLAIVSWNGLRAFQHQLNPSEGHLTVVPLCDVKQQYVELKPEIDAALQAVAGSGSYILGENVRQFEREVAERFACRAAVGVASGTDALHLALRALGIGPGDEVITTSLTFIATAEAISLLGATPVFVDIDPRTFNIDPLRIEAAITPRSKVILPVHLFGQPCDMDPIVAVARRHRLWVVEDCAQAFGACYRGQPVGTIGDVGCLSFFPSKNLGCLGDGGMVVTSDADLADRVDSLRRHGGRVKYHHTETGINSRLDEIQAAVLRIKLAHIDRWNDARRRHVARYNRLLADTPGIVRPVELEYGVLEAVELGGQADNPTHTVDRSVSVYNQYTVLVDGRDRVQRSLKAAGVESAIFYPVPLHLQKVYAGLGYEAGSFPQAECIAHSCLSLPIYPQMSEAQQDTVVEHLCAAIMDSQQNGMTFFASRHSLMS